MAKNRFKSLLSLLLLSSTSVMAQAVPSYRCMPTQAEVRENKDIKSCPEVRKNSNFVGLDNTYPTGSVFIVHEPKYNNSLLIKEVLNWMESNPIAVLNILVTNKAEVSADFLELISSSAQVNLIEMPDKNLSTYVQDYFQAIYHKGKPTLLTTLNPHDSSPPFLLTSNELGKQCFIPTLSTVKDYSAEYFMDKNVYVQATEGSMGGNIEVMPGGFWIIGKDKSIASIKSFNQFNKMIEKNRSNLTIIPEEKLGEYANFVWKSFENTISQNNKIAQNVLVEDLDTTISPVHHVDELFNILKKDDSKCGFVLLSASPNKAYEVLANEPMYGDDRLVSCGSRTDSWSLPRFDWELGPQEEIKRACLGFSYYNKFEVLENKEIRAVNDKFQQIQNKNERQLSIRLSKATGCSNIDILRVPYLINYELDSTGSYIDILPNPANGMVLTPVIGASTYLFPKTYYVGFDSYVEGQLSQRGIVAKSVWAYAYSSGRGGLHCGSNTIPLCK